MWLALCTKECSHRGLPLGSVSLSKAAHPLSLLRGEGNLDWAEKLPPEREKGIRLLLENRGITWNALQMAATSTTKKVITKRVHHNMLLKTLGIVLTFPSTLFPRVLSLQPNPNL